MAYFANVNVTGLMLLTLAAALFHIHSDFVLIRIESGWFRFKLINVTLSKKHLALYWRGTDVWQFVLCAKGPR